MVVNTHEGDWAATCVNYGCGFSAPAGWLNFDASPTVYVQRLPGIGRLLVRGGTRFPENVLYGNIVKGLRVPAGGVKCVYACHVLEHLTRDEFSIALRNTFGMLVSGGIFRLVVPDLRTQVETYINQTASRKVDANDFFLRSSGLGRERGPGTPMAYLRHALGRSEHMWAWDWPSIQDQLLKSGFVGVRRCAFGDYGDPAFADLETEDRVAWSVAAEGTKP